MPPSPPRQHRRRDGRPSPTVSVVIPALNEEHNLPLVLEGLPAGRRGRSSWTADRPTTRCAVAREVRPDAVVVRQTRSGKGNALVCGFAASTGDIVVTLNARRLGRPAARSPVRRRAARRRRGRPTARAIRAGGGDLDRRRLDRFGNAPLSRIVNVFFGTRFTDLELRLQRLLARAAAGARPARPPMPGLKRGRLAWGDGPEIEPLVNIRMAAQGLRVVEVASVGYPAHQRRRPAAQPAARGPARAADRLERIRPPLEDRAPLGPAAPRGRPRQRRRAEHGRATRLRRPPGRRPPARTNRPGGTPARHAVPPPDRDRDSRDRDGRTGTRRGRGRVAGSNAGRGSEPGRPDLTVIEGEGRDEHRNDPPHLRAVPRARTPGATRPCFRRGPTATAAVQGSAGRAPGSPGYRCGTWAIPACGQAAARARRSPAALLAHGPDVLARSRSRGRICSP